MSFLGSTIFFEPALAKSHKYTSREVNLQQTRKTKLS